MNHSYNARPLPRPRQTAKDRRISVLMLCVPVILALAYVVYALLRPVGTPTTTIIPPVVPGQVAVNIPWPASGEAAYGASGYGLLATHGDQVPTPTASVAKVITALAVLQKKPLVPGQPGPTLTMSAADTAIYSAYANQDGSVVPVSEGETISEYQALQAMMLPSANNIADTTAIWAFGSMEAYRAYASGMIKSLGMNSTTIGSDASGFAPSTTSTAADLIKLGDAALKNPTLAQIVAQKSATFPEYGEVNNVNSLLGQSGIRGIKTGNTDEAGGCLLAAADVPMNGQTITVITAIMNVPNLRASLRDTLPMVQSTVSLFHTVHVVSAGQSVGSVTTPWGSASRIISAKSIDVLAWNGAALSPRTFKKSVPLSAAPHMNAGSLSLIYQDKSYTSDLFTTNSLQGPSLLWRLRHPV